MRVVLLTAAFMIPVVAFLLAPAPANMAMAGTASEARRVSRKVVQQVAPVEFEVSEVVIRQPKPVKAKVFTYQVPNQEFGWRKTKMVWSSTPGLVRSLKVR